MRLDDYDAVRTAAVVRVLSALFKLFPGHLNYETDQV